MEGNYITDYQAEHKRVKERIKEHKSYYSVLIEQGKVSTEEAANVLRNIKEYTAELNRINTAWRRVRQFDLEAFVFGS